MGAATLESFGLLVKKIPVVLKTQKNIVKCWNVLTIWALQIHSLPPTHGTFQISLFSVVRCCIARSEFTFSVHDVARGPRFWGSYVLILLPQMLLTDPVKSVPLICVKVSFELDNRMREGSRGL